MRRDYTSDYYDLGRLNEHGWTKEKVIKHALSKILHRTALYLELEADRDEIDVPTNIRIEIVEKGWDLYVRLHMEEADVLSTELSN